MHMSKGASRWGRSLLCFWSFGKRALARNATRSRFVEQHMDGVVREMGETRETNAASRAGAPAASGSAAAAVSEGATPVIELDGLSVRFGRRQILTDLRSRLSGRSIGLLGPNGSGKTTLIHTLLGFHEPSSGTARIFGKDIRTE